MKAVNHNPSAAELRSFGWVMLGGFAIIGALLWYASVTGPGRWWPEAGWGWQGHGRQTAAAALWGFGALCWLTAMTAPGVARLLYVGWMTVAKYLGTVSTFVLLSVLFFVCLPLFSLIRFTDPLRLKLHGMKTFWEEPKPHEPTLARMRLPF